MSGLYPSGGFPSDLSYVGRPNERFMWNRYLLEPVQPHSGEPLLGHEWVLPIVHGFVQQNNLSVFGRPVFVTLVARRSSAYAGPRFLKRGANEAGEVANEVETEQIVLDGRRATSFVQIRGSVPGLWGQEISNMMPKPQIFLKSKDLYCLVAGVKSS